MPSNIRLERAAHLIYTRVKREEVLRKALQSVIATYEYIIIENRADVVVQTSLKRFGRDRAAVEEQLKTFLSRN